ncbi:DUF2018 family protein [Campylobacter helveticus]|uniref:DUF2018 family protein n=1 Tax=Campylobacter helveticus TaxID=28898 RepID=UPI00111299E9|nr:DUF2018 family protein [Campylobacter helveticus]TNB65898.1 DUF2018 family protein [Campylobacter helveticus]
MDIFDSMFNKSPQEKFLEIVQNGNLGALEKTFENFFAEYIAMIELLEKQGLNENDVKNFILENNELIEQRQNDIYIELGAKILGHEG